MFKWRESAIDLRTSTIILAVAWVVIATLHGYGAAWLAIRMLFRPYKRVKLFKITIWPQGMIPRHRDRLAQTIGNAVGNELVSQETVFNALFEDDFFKRKVEAVVTSYTKDLLDTNYASFVEAIPSEARAPVLDTISALQYRLAAHIVAILKSEETSDAIRSFMGRRLDELLARRISETIDDKAFEHILSFIDDRFRRLVSEEGFRDKLRGFTASRVEELANSDASLAAMFRPETIDVIKERIDQQVPPIVHHLAEIATSKNTRTHIGALIKREVDDYYTQLSFFKKIFVSRERIHREVDEMVNKTMPRRVEEYLRGPAFELEAENFLNSTIDSVLSRPIREIVGKIAPERLEAIKDQIADRILALVQSVELQTSVSAYLRDALERLRPHTLRALLQNLNPESTTRLKSFLTKSTLSILVRPETASAINSILSSQIERLLVAPIGRLGDHMPADTVARASAALTERITTAARERLPGAIAEFDIGSIVRRKVAEYPLEKLESLVLSVAQQHLKTIELFGAAIGLMIGITQGLYTIRAPQAVYHWLAAFH